jgi:capsular polysaccharide export protein
MRRPAALAKETGGSVAAWASRDLTRIGEACAKAGAPLVRVEDGFIRSAGLGASFVAPLSLVFDRRGIYYDPRATSDLEALLGEAEMPASLVERARRLREKLVATGTTKYNIRPPPCCASKGADAHRSWWSARSRTMPRSAMDRRTA